MTLNYMFVFIYFIAGAACGFAFRAYALVVLTPLGFLIGMLISLITGQDLGEALWSGLLLLATFQLAYVLGAICDGLIKRG